VSDTADQLERRAALARAVDCPECGYSLRGLPGVIVTCPECGRRCYLPALIAQHRRDWTSSKLYHMLGNSAITLLGALLAVAGARVTIHAHPAAPAVLVASGIGLLALWLRLIARLFRWCAAWEALRLAVLMQILVVSFVVCGSLAWAGVITLVGIIFSALTENDPVLLIKMVVGTSVAVAVGFGGLRLCRLLDRRIGRRCIAWELEAGG
jgi:hypothetical protein